MISFINPKSNSGQFFLWNILLGWTIILWIFLIFASFRNTKDVYDDDEQDDAEDSVFTNFNPRGYTEKVIKWWK